ncbi:MAG: phage major capsid protein [Nitrososphaerota archaeon]
MIRPYWSSWSGLENKIRPKLTDAEKERRADEYAEFGKALFEKGYLSTDTNFPRLPPAVAEDILNIVRYANPVRNYFRWYQMPAPEFRIKAKSAGVTISAPTEGTTPSESKPTWTTDVVLSAKELRAWTDVSTIAVEDQVIDIVADLVRDFGLAIAEVEGYNALQGDASGSNAKNLFKGISKVTSSDGAYVATISDTAFNSVTFTHFAAAVEYLEDYLGSGKGLVAFGNPRALGYLRRNLTVDLKLPGFSDRIISTGEIQSILGVEDVISTPLLERRDKTISTTTKKVADIVICAVDRAAFGGDRRSLTIEQGPKDVKSGLTPYAVSERIAWAIGDAKAIAILKDCLAE